MEVFTGGNWRNAESTDDRPLEISTCGFDTDCKTHLASANAVR
jgi:hypothetical protein